MLGKTINALTQSIVKKTASFSALSLLMFCLVPSNASAMQYSNLFVFGDSLSDVGNVSILSGGTMPPSPPYYNGRYSNGPVAAEILANNYMGTTLTPSLLGGNNYAVAGATTGTLNEEPLLNGTGMQSQVNAFVTAAPVFNANTTLFMLWGGANDFFVNPSVTTIASVLNNLSNEIAMLNGIGAQHFLVPNLPDLGIIPAGLAQGAATATALSSLSQFYNQNLASTLTTLGSSLGAHIVTFDTAGLMADVVSNPSAYGFTNTTDACLTMSSICANPSEYLFWDDVHPSAQAHALLASRFADALVPEPTDFALLLVGGLALIFSRRRLL